MKLYRCIKDVKFLHNKVSCFTKGTIYEAVVHKPPYLNFCIIIIASNNGCCYEFNENDVAENFEEVKIEKRFVIQNVIGFTFAKRIFDCKESVEVFSGVVCVAQEYCNLLNIGNYYSQVAKSTNNKKGGIMPTVAKKAPAKKAVVKPAEKKTVAKKVTKKAK